MWNCICNIFIEADNLEQVQLDTIEPLLCSAFESKHKHIVNTVSVMWNRAFEHADEVQYPDKLRAVLLSLRRYVDIVLPGLDVSGPEDIVRQPVFIDSQDDPDTVLTPRAAIKATPRVEKRSSSRRSRSNTPGSIKLSVPNQRRLEATPDAHRLRSARRSTTPGLRHDDSQIQFAVIASSSPSHNIMESQTLTERQKEVRERQQVNVALFPEIRSSMEKERPELREKKGSPNIFKDEKVITPKSHRTFEDYVSSTPTPRRGQAHLIDENDHEMTDDIPSSPPDPRRYPLVPEINKTLSSSSSVLDDWHFTSSPVSGSPRYQRPVTLSEQRVVEPESQNLAGVQPAVDEPGNSLPGLSEDEGNHADVEDESLDVPMGGVEDVLPPASQRMGTPPNTRVQKRQGTPKSDTEVFVDALTSPVPHTPRGQRALARAAHSAPAQVYRALQAKDRSFDASDVDERSLMRLADELDSLQCDIVPEGGGQEKEKGRPSLAQSRSPVLDCITVNTGSNKSIRRSKRSNPSKFSSPAIPSTPAEGGSSQESTNKSKRKRKRAAERSQEPDNKKRRHSQDLDTDNETVPDSQLPTVHDGKPSLPSTTAETRLTVKLDTSSGQSKTSGRERPTSFSSPAHDDEAVLTNEEPASADSSMDDSEAVHLQIVQEASQNTEEEAPPMEPLAAALEEVHTAELAPLPTDEVGAAEQSVDGGQMMSQEKAVPTPADAGEAESAPVPEKSALEKIMDALKNSITELQKAALSRDDVHQVETMFMDIKRELYGAEFRGRN